MYKNKWDKKCAHISILYMQDLVHACVQHPNECYAFKSMIQHMNINCLTITSTLNDGKMFVARRGTEFSSLTGKGMNISIMSFKASY